MDPAKVVCLMMGKSGYEIYKFALTCMPVVAIS